MQRLRRKGLLRPHDCGRLLPMLLRLKGKTPADAFAGVRVRPDSSARRTSRLLMISIQKDFLLTH